MKTDTKAQIAAPKKQWMEPELVELPIGATRAATDAPLAGDGGLTMPVVYS